MWGEEERKKKCKKMGEGTVGLRFERDEELGEGERKRGVGCA